MLSKMFSSTIPKMKDKDGCIFIDRSGKHFNKILDYLRNGILPSLKDKIEAQELLCEADFYCIEKLKSHCQAYKSPKEIMIYSYIDTPNCTGDAKDHFDSQSEENAYCYKVKIRAVKLPYQCD